MITRTVKAYNSRFNSDESIQKFVAKVPWKQVNFLKSSNGVACSFKRNCELLWTIYCKKVIRDL